MTVRLQVHQVEMPNAEELFSSPLSGGPHPVEAVKAINHPESATPSIDEIAIRSGLHGLTGESPAEDVADSLKRYVSDSGPAPLDREVARDHALLVLKQQGVREARRYVTAAFKHARETTGTGGKERVQQGRPVEFEDPEPSEQPVNGIVLADTLRSAVTRHVALAPEAAVAVVLWILLTYLVPVLTLVPMLAITSATMRCGKTHLLTVVGALVPRPLYAASLTPAVVFRAIEKYAPTLLIDEADTFLGRNPELTGVLNSGHTRATARVLRIVGDEMEPRVFLTFAAKAIALIGDLFSTLADRSIEVRMERRMPDQHVERLRQDRIHAELEPLRRQCARWAADHASELKAADPEIPQGLHDRAADNWRAPVAIADLIGGEWPNDARRAARALSGADTDDGPSVQLLRDIAGIFERAGHPDAMQTAEIVKALHGLDDRPWAEWRAGDPLTPTGMATLLRPFGIYSAGTVRFGSKTAKAYTRRSFEDAWERYRVRPGTPSHYQKGRG